MIPDFSRGGKASPPISLLKISPHGVFEGLGKHSSIITDKSWWLCFNEYDVEASESTGVGIPLLLSLWFWEGPLQHSSFTLIFQEDCRGLLWQYRDLDSCNWRNSWFYPIFSAERHIPERLDSHASWCYWKHYFLCSVTGCCMQTQRSWTRDSTILEGVACKVWGSLHSLPLMSEVYQREMFELSF